MENNDLAEAVGHAIRARRRASGLSQDQFADRIGMHRAYFSAIERGEKNLTLRTLWKVANGLECSIAVLLQEADL